MVLGQVDAPLQQQTINGQLSPGQNRQSSPLITPAYHGLESLVIAGQERPTDWLRIPAPPCLPPRPLEPARRSRRRGPTITPRGTPALMQDRPCSGARCRSAFASVAIPFFRTRKNYRREIRKAAETLSFRRPVGNYFWRRWVGFRTSAGPTRRSAPM